jgi:hypothetical protein
LDVPEHSPYILIARVLAGKEHSQTVVSEVLNYRIATVKAFGLTVKVEPGASLATLKFDINPSPLFA